MNIDIDKMAQGAFNMSIEDLSDQITQLNNLVDTLKLVRDIRIKNMKKSSHHTKKKLSKSVSNVVDRIEKNQSQMTKNMSDQSASQTVNHPD